MATKKYTCICCETNGLCFHPDWDKYLASETEKVIIDSVSHLEYIVEETYNTTTVKQKETYNKMLASNTELHII